MEVVQQSVIALIVSSGFAMEREEFFQNLYGKTKFLLDFFIHIFSNLSRCYSSYLASYCIISDFCVKEIPLEATTSDRDSPETVEGQSDSCVLSEQTAPAESQSAAQIGHNSPSPEQSPFAENQSAIRSQESVAESTEVSEESLHPEEQATISDRSSPAEDHSSPVSEHSTEAAVSAEPNSVHEGMGDSNVAEVKEKFDLLRDDFFSR